MKKSLLVILSCLLLIGVTSACNSISPSMDIYNKSVKAMKDANSYNFEIALKQEILFDLQEQQEKMQMNMMVHGSMIEDPLTMGMSISLDLGEGISPELKEFNQATIQYFVKDQHIYMKNPMLGDLWLKEPLDSVGELSFELDPKYMIENFGLGADYAEITEQGQYYILTIDGKKNNRVEAIFSDLLSAILQNAGVSDEINGSNASSTKAEFNHITLELWISKDTNLQEKMLMEVEIKINDGLDSFAITQSLEIKFSEIGRIPSIDIPSDVLAQAITLQELLNTN